jgi:transposase
MHHARAGAAVPLSPEERQSLERWAGGRDRRLARRAAIVLGFAEGEEAKALARRFRLSEPTVVKWRTRFEASRLAGLVDAARSGAPRRILNDDVERVLAHMALPPPAGQARWTTRSLARACGLSQTTVSRIWRAHGVDPHARTLAAPPARSRADPDRSPRASGTALEDPENWGSELAWLARELHELQALAPPEQGPFLRIALEALDGAIDSSQRLRAARDGSRHVRARTEAAINQARALVKEARVRTAALRALVQEG